MNAYTYVAYKHTHTHSLSFSLSLSLSLSHTQVLGLQFGVSYNADNVRKLLRYDHFVIFCDQVPNMS